ncbi:MAG: hypothetical protein ABI208_03690, partial [Ginsengibacter sp.]
MRAFHKNLLFLFFINAFLCLANIAFAQSDNKTASGLLQEKLYVQTDKPNYLCGEIIWFNTYVTDASTHHLLSMSKVVYVELLNAANEPVIQTKIAVDSGLGNGSISLPFSLSSGQYTLRAYTNWMKNFSSDYYFTKTISIINTTNNPESITSLISDTITAEFFPEGGDLVTGLLNHIAFKISNSEGKGINGKGIIIDQNNDTAAVFQSFKTGMGQFNFIPKTGKTYTAQITTNENQSITAKLPTALNSGYAMHTEEQSNGDVEVSFSRAGFSPNSSAYLVVYHQQKLIGTFVVSVVNNQGNFLLQKSQLSEGVN